MKRLLPGLLFLTLLALDLHGQQSRYIIRFRDKANSPFSLQQPSAFLSPRALERRARFSIPLDESDLPVNPSYIQQVLQSGNVNLLNRSRWFNQILIQTTDAQAIQAINQLPFVLQVNTIAPRKKPLPDPKRDIERILPSAKPERRQQRSTEDRYDYGYAYPQIHIHEGEFLHNRGFSGQGMYVAMFDAGFNSYTTNPAFDSVRTDNRIPYTMDLVSGGTQVEEDDLHGMYCLSIMASNMPGNMVGSAPAASYYLFRTEDPFSEYPVEEQNWLAAAEIADSLGVDVITSSLGYSEFYDAQYNHVYSDMDGNTTLVTRAADMAARKGILVTNSAGNSGNDAWRYIIAPADGDSVLAVGAINKDRQVASFSSYGPSADGRVKPDITSVGWFTAITWITGEVFPGNGTSFSNPNLCGLIVCLWQAFPEFNNMEILDAVRRSADQYTNPDDRVGYGVPNFRLAYSWLQQKRQEKMQQKLSEEQLIVYPNPVVSELNILLKPSATGNASLRLLDAGGKLHRFTRVGVYENEILQMKLWNDLSSLPSGIYYLEYRDGSVRKTVKVVRP